MKIIYQFSLLLFQAKYLTKYSEQIWTNLFVYLFVSGQADKDDEKFRFARKIPVRLVENRLNDLMHLKV